MMEFLNILKEGKEYKEQVYALYETAFPKEEQKPISYMEKWAEEGKAELLAVVEEREFIGLVMNMFSSSAAVLDYFAISPEKEAEDMEAKQSGVSWNGFRDKNMFLKLKNRTIGRKCRGQKRRKAFI